MSETFDKSQMSETIDVPAGCVSSHQAKGKNLNTSYMYKGHIFKSVECLHFCIWYQVKM